MKVALLTLFGFGLLFSRPILRADSFPSTPGFFTTIDVPGATNTSINAISSSGNYLAGTFSDGTGEHGFVDKQGVFTRVDFPGEVTGINDAGQVVGTYGVPGELFGHGFLYANGVVSDLGSDLFAQGINNAGVISGFSYYFGCHQFACGSGFVYSNETVTNYSIHSAALTAFYGINNNGDIVGSYTDFAGGPSGRFIFNGGNFYTAYGLEGVPSARPRGINDAGHMVGTFVDESGNTSGFLYSNSMFSTLDFYPTGISNSDQIVGGGDFIFTATPEPSSLLLFGFGLVAIGIMMRRTRSGR